MHPTGIEAAKLQQRAQEPQAAFLDSITVQVMAVAEPSAAHKHPVDPLLKGQQDMMGRNRGAAHHPDHPEMRRVLEATDPGQVSGGVGSPSAQETQNAGFEVQLAHCPSNLRRISYDDLEKSRHSRGGVNPKES